MELTVTQKNLSRALADCSRVASARAGLPVLGNILLKTDSAGLYIAATNLEIASTVKIGAKIDKPGAITVPAKLITELVSNLPNETVTLSTKAAILSIACGGYTSSINGIDAEEFPELPVIDEKKSVQYAIAPELFKKAVTQTIFSCSNDTTRPVLTGVYWHSHDGYLYIAGTDGYRLAQKRITATQSQLTAIVPTTALQEVLRTLHDGVEEIEVLFDETQVRFRVDSSEITSRLIEGNYPDYRQLIPKENPTRTVVPLAEFVRMTKLASLFARDTGGSITITTDADSSEFSIKSTASEMGESLSKIETTIEGGGSVSLNSRYLTDVLSVIDTDSITIAYGAKLSPITIQPNQKDTDYLSIIMPLKS
jgi:DNA polymerase-3 subunit beta